MKTFTLKQWQEKGAKLFGDDFKTWKFVCPSCGNIQCINDFLDFMTLDQAMSVAHYSCIGRWLENGNNDMCSGKQPCNYTLGGLFCIATTMIITDDEKKHFVFDFKEK